ncbi:hypothetical protein ACA910_012123 [Epithemia clementina (nom. ined.)]
MNFTTTTTTTTTTTASTTKPNSDLSFWSRDELQRLAQEQEGVVLSLSTLGPAFRAVARSQYNSSLILGYIEGFVRFGNVLHLDTMHVYGPMVQEARQEHARQKKQEQQHQNQQQKQLERTASFSSSSSFLGVGLYMAYLCVWHGLYERGCTRAEVLAIHDGDWQHRRLVKTYRIAGFDVVKYVGDDLGDIPDRMVWGGCGTLMRATNLPQLLQQWTKILSPKTRTTATATTTTTKTNNAQTTTQFVEEEENDNDNDNDNDNNNAMDNYME